MITSLDELNAGGYPTVETIQKLYDQLDMHRTTQAYLDFMPAMSMQAVLDAHPATSGSANRQGCMIVYVEPGEGQVDRNRPDLQHREHLRQRLSLRPEAGRARP